MLSCTRPVGVSTGPKGAGGLGLGGAAASCFSQELLGSTSQDPSSAELNQELWTLRRVTSRPPPSRCRQALWKEATQGVSGKKMTQKTPAQSTGSSPLPQKRLPKQNRIHTKEEILQQNFKRRKRDEEGGGGSHRGRLRGTLGSSLRSPAEGEGDEVFPPPPNPGYYKQCCDEQWGTRVVLMGTQIVLSSNSYHPISLDVF